MSFAAGKGGSRPGPRPVPGRSSVDQRRTTRTIPRLIFGAAVAVLLVLMVVALARLNTRPELPKVDLTAVDPLIVEAIQTAEQKVRDHPRSGDAWGELATVYAVHDFASAAEPCFIKAEHFSPKEAQWPYLAMLGLVAAAVLPFARAPFALRRSIGGARQNR